MALVKSALTTATAVVLTTISTLPSATALVNLKTDWEAYVSALPVPTVIDMTQGGHLDMDIGQASHDWTEDGAISGQVYGYAMMDQTPTFPGPSIVVAKNVPISITWHNKLTAPHLLAQSVEQSIFLNESLCYPNCGVPAVTHLHGGELPAEYDGLPFKTIYKDESKEFEYNNRQLESTAIYHDHADGLNRLNTWAGLMGAYVIQDAEKEESLNLNIATNYPLVINDRLIDTSGNLLYSDDNCNAGATVWVPESFGNVNLVNGRVMPYVEVPPAQVRFRVVNAANSRHYEFPVPFPNLCKVVATDSGFVETPQVLGATLVIFPLERVEIVCDFTGVADGTAYELVDIQSATQSTPYDPHVLQIRVVESLLTDSMPVRKIPSTLNKFKSLKALYEAGGEERNVTLTEMTDAMSCPTMTTIHYKEKQVNISNIADTLQCVKGTVEKWNFINPTADPHPFHWHLIHVQCGDTEGTIKTNELKDVAVIPSAGDRTTDTITQVCYVACTPGDYLIENSTREADDFGFDTTEPYVAHCHILEHEENMMMSWFRIIDNYRSSGSNDSSSTSSTVGSESHSSSADGSSSPTVGSGSWSNVGSGVGSESYSHAGEDSYPAKNVTYAQYHGFGTEEYARYHRCDGHFNRHGMYTTTNSGSHGTNANNGTSSERIERDYVMTAMSSTVVHKAQQAQYGDADRDAVVQDDQGYPRTDSSSGVMTGESDAGQGYTGADSNMEGTNTNVAGSTGAPTSENADDTFASGSEGYFMTNTSVHFTITTADGVTESNKDVTANTDGNAGQGYIATNSDVDSMTTTAAGVVESNDGAIAEINTGSYSTDSTSTVVASSQGVVAHGHFTDLDNTSARINSNTDATTSFTSSSTTDDSVAADRAYTPSGDATTASICTMTTSTTGTAGRKTHSSKGLSRGISTDNTAGEGDAGQGYIQTDYDSVATNKVTTRDKSDGTDGDVDADEGYAQTSSDATAVAGEITSSNKEAPLDAATATDNTPEYIRKCDGD